MKRKKSGLWFVFGGMALLIGMLSLMVLPKLQEFWNQPLGPGLGFEDATLIPSEPALTALANLPDQITLSPEIQNTSTAVLETAPANPLEPTLTPVLIPTFTPDTFCGETREMILLVVGTDSRSNSYTYGLADVTRIVHIDFTIPRVAVLSFPRDLWVEVPDISDHYGITHSKLNQAYFYGSPGMGYYDGPGAGAGLLARTLELNFGVRPEHYGVVNMRTLEAIIDAVGGVNIYLDVGIDARESPESQERWKIYPAGWNHLDGKRAVYYARIRKIDNVFGRMDRQTEILCALKTELLKPSAIMSIPQIIEAFTGQVLTDLSPAQLSQLACLAPNLKWENIVFARFPEDELKGISGWDENMHMYNFMWDADYERLREYVRQFLEGTWPPPPIEGETDSAHEGESQQLCPVYPERP